MRLSVFTPSHDSRYLDECYRSLTAQTHTDWEWVVLLNGKARPWAPPADDPRVVVRRSSARLTAVGAAKRAACELATGEVLVELDHDDVLLPTCLEHVAAALARNTDTVLVYSDFAQIDAASQPDRNRFDPAMGWVYTEKRVDDAVYLQCHALAATPHNMGYIWYAPNHVRAFRRSAYEKVGGYDAQRTVLDDQDLMSRLFRVGDFTHVPELLYLQRMHAKNTQVAPRTNERIQEETVTHYQGNIEELALAWARRSGLAALQLVTSSTVPADEPAASDYTDVLLDPADPRLPYGPDEVGVIKAIDILQRLPDRSAFLNESYRVLVHAGMLLTDTPSTDGRGAFQDPSHVAFYNENSFMYLTQARLRMTIPTLTARLQVSHLTTYYPSEVHVDLDIPYVKGNLLAVKDGPRQGGPLLC